MLEIISVILASSSFAMLQHMGELPDWYYEKLNFKPFSCAPCLSTWFSFTLLLFIQPELIYFVTIPLSNWLITLMIINNIER